MISLHQRDLGGFGNGSTGYGPIFFAMLMVLFTCCVILTLLYFLRQRRLAARRYTSLPIHQRGHHRTLTITTHPTTTGGDSIFVYDEKMNLIANSSHASQSPVPEIHVTFPDEEGKSGDKKSGGVFVVCISDTGSIGMKPLHQESLPPYQSKEAERLQSLDLERIGGLKEKPSSSSQRWS